MTAIDNDAAENDHAIDDNFDSESAFAKLWNEDAETPSDTEAEDEDEKKEGSEETDETEGDEGDEKSTDETEGDEGDEESEDEDNDAHVEVKDEFKVKVKVGDKEEEFTIGSLKRLAGQEAALTQKSQEAASKRKQIDTMAATQLAAYDRLLKDAEAAFEPYKNLDLLTLSRDPNISNEDLTQLRSLAQAAEARVNFLKSEMGAFQGQIQKVRSQELREQAAATVKELSDPEKGIPGFSEKLYGDMMAFAKSQGVPEDAVNEIVDPISLRILHKAMLYDRGVAKVKQETDPKTTTKKKVAKAPKKIIKSISNSESNKEVLRGSKTERERTALKRLRTSGDDDAAIDAFAARFGGSRDDD